MVIAKTFVSDTSGQYMKTGYFEIEIVPKYPDTVGEFKAAKAWGKMAVFSLIRKPTHVPASSTH
jgi:hypothetical protein